MKHWITVVVLMLAIAVMTGWAAAAEPVSKPSSAEASLARYFQSVHTLRGDFVQETQDESGTVVDRGEGHFTIERPGLFNWVYETPYKQRIVGDGKWLWVHDVDLRQITVRPMDDVLGVGPAILLSGSFEDLQDKFTIKTQGGGWLALTPIDEQWDFQSARLRMADGVPVELALDDGLGRTISLRLSDLESNFSVPDHTFATDVPKGTDVIAPPAYKAGAG